MYVGWLSSSLIFRTVAYCYVCDLEALAKAHVASNAIPRKPTFFIPCLSFRAETANCPVTIHAETSCPEVSATTDRDSHHRCAGATVFVGEDSRGVRNGWGTVVKTVIHKHGERWIVIVLDWSDGNCEVETFGSPRAAPTLLHHCRGVEFSDFQHSPRRSFGDEL
jgi:hypothetical protein